MLSRFGVSKGAHVHSGDGPSGHVRTLYFDDGSWHLGAKMPTVGRKHVSERIVRG